MESPSQSDTGNSAENRKPDKAPHLAPYRFQPGQSGNPNGRPKKKPLTELYEKILANPEYLEQLEASVVKSLRRGQMAMVLQLREMAERVEGKVTQPVEVNGELTLTLSERMQRARDRAKSSGPGTATS